MTFRRTNVRRKVIPDEHGGAQGAAERRSGIGQPRAATSRMHGPESVVPHDMGPIMDE